MGIRRRHIRETLEKIIKEEIQKGKYPNTETITNRLRKEFDKHQPGMPKFSPIAAPKNGVSSPADYNEMIDEIYEDLYMVFTETSEQANRLLKNFDYGEVERNKILKRLEKLEDSIDNLLLLAENTDGYLDSIYDNFHDYEKIDMENTTANVDLKSREVSLSEIKSDGKKYSLKNRKYEVEIIGESGKLETVEPFSNALDDYLNSAWMTKLVKKDKSPATIEVVIHLTDLENDPNDKFADEIMVSSLEFVDSSPKITEVSAMWSNDNINYFSIDKNKQLVNVVENEKWICDETPMQYIKLRLTKKEPDKELEDGSFLYRFGSKSIDVKKVGFKEAGKFVSKSHDVSNIDSANPINQVSLDVVEELPKFTSINYFLEFPDSNGLIPISKIEDPNPKHPKIINLDNISTPNPIEITGGSNKIDTHNGIDFYNLKSLGYTPTNGSVSLYRGKNMWKKQEFVTETYKATDYSHDPTLRDWVNLPQDVKKSDIKPDFLNSTSVLNKSNAQGAMSKWTTYIYCSETQTVKETITTGKDINTSIILNGRTVSVDESGNYVMRMPVGWNKIEVLNYNKDNNSASIDINFSPHDYGKMLAENSPLEKVSTYDLKNNVLMNDKNKYAIDGNKIILNYDPNGMKYEISYSYALSTGFKEIKLVAQLKRERDQASLTPKLKKYNIRIS